MTKNIYSRFLQKKSTVASGFFWNMMGSGINSLSSVILLMFVNRINGAADGGIFAFGYALSQLMWSIGSFETMTYQVTDTKNKFSFSEYYGFKILLCIAMIVISAADIAIRGGDSYKIVIAFLLCVFRMIDVFSNHFFSSLQKEGYLGIAGFSYFIRLLLANGIMVAALFISKDTAFSIILSCVVEIIWVALFEMPLTSNLFKLKPSFRFDKVKSLFVGCLPLFLSIFILSYITNLPKYIIDKYMTPEDVNTFSILFMPAFVINLMGSFIFRPMLTKLSAAWNSRNYHSFLKQSIFILLCIFAALTLVLLVGYFLGLPVLSWFYGVPLDGYLPIFMIILLGGGFTALSGGLYNIITVMRKQKILVIGYAIGLIVGLITAKPLVQHYGLDGGAYLFILPTLLVAIIFLISFFILFYKDKRKQHN